MTYGRLPPSGFSLPICVNGVLMGIICQVLIYFAFKTSSKLVRKTTLVLLLDIQSPNFLLYDCQIYKYHAFSLFLTTE